MDRRDGRIAFVGELCEQDDASRLSGLFAVHWQSVDGNRHGDGPEGVSIEEAIAWGCQHARFVSVQLGDGDTSYSAGELDLNDLDGDFEDPDWEPAVAWPAQGLVVASRPMGAPPDGSVQEVDWLIESTAGNMPTGGRDRLPRMRQLLGEDGRLREIELSASANRLSMRCVIRASGGAPAVLAVDEIFRNAIATFPERSSAAGHPGDSTSCLGPVGSRPRTPPAPASRRLG